MVATEGQPITFTKILLNSTEVYRSILNIWIFLSMQVNLPLEGNSNYYQL